MTLAEWLAVNHVSHDDFAARIGAKRSSVTRYVSGERMPRPEKLAAIARETGGLVTANDFVGSVDRPDERNTSDTEAAA
jgi:DNA-binding transcriptional regulator YdaS (Cro superfamily)